jgi:two-component system, cell cycle sensor histidine kinase and response regulator CckA
MEPNSIEVETLNESLRLSSTFSDLNNVQTIMLVEDEEFVRKVACEVLQAAGYEVLAATNAAEAKNILSNSMRVINLLLTDVVLPDQNGYDLARDLSKTNPHLVTMFMSGYAKHSVRSDLSQPPNVFYLPKPFSAKSLTEAVRQALGNQINFAEASILVEIGDSN